MAADNRTEPGQQFSCVERFGQIIIRTGIKSRNPVFYFRPGSQHQAGGRNPVTAQFAEHRDAAHFRHHPVQDDTVKAAGFRHLQRIRTVIYRFNGISFMLKERPRRAAQLPVIVRK